MNPSSWQVGRAKPLGVAHPISFGVAAATACALYKSRWQVELFFKWITMKAVAYSLRD
jgi:IS4 transposase